MAVDLRDLMRRYCDGDEAAFAELHAVMAPRLYHQGDPRKVTA